MALSNTQMEQIKKSYNLDKIELEQQKQTNQIRLISLIVISAILIVLFISLFRLSKIRKALKYSESEIRKAAGLHAAAVGKYGSGNQRNKKSLPDKHEL